MQLVNEEQQLPFDVLLATPEMAPLFRPHGRILGPKGLMPSEKKGTVVKDFSSFSRKEVKGIELKLDGAGETKKGGMIRVVVGKVTHYVLHELTSSSNKMITRLKRISGHLSKR